jgi:hypothetical protein
MTTNIADPFYEPLIPIRWLVKQRDVDETRTAWGISTKRITETYRVLQFWSDDGKGWCDVPEVAVVAEEGSR